MPSQDLSMLIRLPAVRHHELTTFSFRVGMTFGNRENGYYESRIETGDHYGLVPLEHPNQDSRQPKGFFWGLGIEGK